MIEIALQAASQKIRRGDVDHAVVVDVDFATRALDDPADLYHQADHVADVAPASRSSSGCEGHSWRCRASSDRLGHLAENVDPAVVRLLESWRMVGFVHALRS